MFETLRQAAGNLLQCLLGREERHRGRRFDRVERDLAAHDLDQIQQHSDALLPRQQAWLDWAGTILADPNAPDEKVGQALDSLREIRRAFPVSGLLIVPLRLDGPDYEEAKKVPPIDPAWLTRDVRMVAEALYQERRFADLGILADALEEAGCLDSGILGPMRRKPTPHIRGVRVLYAILGVG